MPSFKSMIVSFTLVASALAGQPSPAQVEKAIHFNEGSLELTRRPFPDYYKSKMIKLADFEAFHITFRAGGTVRLKFFSHFFFSIISFLFHYVSFLI